MTVSLFRLDGTRTVVVGAGSGWRRGRAWVSPRRTRQTAAIRWEIFAGFLSMFSDHTWS